MGRLAVIGGHSLLGSGYGTEPHAAWSRLDVDVDGTSVALLDVGTHVVLHRHGLDTYTAAHRVDHVAHVRALASIGCDRILAVSSVGGLHPDHRVGTMVMPDDFVALDVSISAHHDERSHIVPELDPAWRATVLRAARAVVADGAVLRDGGVYWQSLGPRFETRAEIRLIANFADVVGMTAASESIVAQELGLPYAVICVVDNLANGIAETPLTLEEFEAGKRADSRVGAPASPRHCAGGRHMTVEPLAITGAVTTSGAPVSLRAVDGVIIELGPDVVSRAGDRVVEAQGDVLLRGLVNGHTHAAMTLFRGYGSDLPLMQWLQDKIWPAEARLTDDAVYWGTRQACIEMVRSGTTCFWDMYWHPVAVARAARDAGCAPPSVHR